MIYEPMVHLAQTVHLSCVEFNTISKRTETSLPLGTDKMISMPMVHSAQTMHVSFARINTISKHNKISFHSTDVTLEFHRVHPK